MDQIITLLHKQNVRHAHVVNTAKVVLKLQRVYVPLAIFVLVVPHLQHHLMIQQNKLLVKDLVVPGYLEDVLKVTHVQEVLNIQLSAHQELIKIKQDKYHANPAHLVTTVLSMV